MKKLSMVLCMLMLFLACAISLGPPGASASEIGIKNLDLAPESACALSFVVLTQSDHILVGREVVFEKGAVIGNTQDAVMGAVAIGGAVMAYRQQPIFIDITLQRSDAAGIAYMKTLTGLARAPVAGMTVPRLVG